MSLNVLFSVALETSVGALKEAKKTGTCTEGWESFCLEAIDSHPLGVMFEFILLLYAFIALAVVCDDYLVPSLETLCVRWNLREDVAGATFMAFGSAVPEIVINAAGTLQGGDAADTGPGAIMGSGMIAFMVVPALCILLSGQTRPLQIKRRPLTRDIFFYLTAVICLLVFMQDGSVSLTESILLVVIYIVYIVSVILSPRIRKWYQLRQLVGEERVHFLNSRSMSFVEKAQLERSASRKSQSVSRTSIQAMAEPLLSSDDPSGLESSEVNADESTASAARKRQLGSSRTIAGTRRLSVKPKEVSFAEESEQPSKVTRALPSVDDKESDDSDTDDDNQVSERPNASAGAYVPPSAKPPVTELARLKKQDGDKAFEKKKEEVQKSGEAQKENQKEESGKSSKELEIIQTEKPSDSDKQEIKPTEKEKVEGGEQPLESKHIDVDTSVAKSDESEDDVSSQVLDAAQQKTEETETKEASVSSEAKAEMPAEEKQNEQQEVAQSVEVTPLETKITIGDTPKELATVSSETNNSQPPQTKEVNPKAVQAKIRKSSKFDDSVNESNVIGEDEPVYSDTRYSDDFGREEDGPDPRDDEERLSADEVLPLDVPIIMGEDGDDDEEEDEDDEPKTWFGKAVYKLSLPLRWIFSWTIPNTKLKSPLESWYPIGFFCSFIWVALISMIISTVISRWGDLSGIAQAFLGVAVVSVGAEIPDIIQSVTVARRGYGSMAVSNCIGSQITNVLIGLGLPWTLSNLITGDKVKIPGKHRIFRAAIILLIFIVIFFSLMVGIAIYRKNNKVQLARWKGFITIVCYFIGIAVFAGLTLCKKDWC